MVESGSIASQLIARLRVSAVAVVALQLSLSVSAALAHPMTYTAPTADQPGKFAGEVPISKLGTVLLPDGLVQFTDDELKIGAVPDWLFDRDVVMRAAIVRAEIVPQKDNSVIAGLVYFLDGAWLNNLASPRALDVIETLSGEHIRGKIIERSGQSFVVRRDDAATRKVDFNDIKTISSPRAYRFNIAAPTPSLSTTDKSLSFDATQILFMPTALTANLVVSRKATVPPSTLPGTDPVVSRRTIATFVAMDLLMDVGSYVAIPLVLNKRNQQAALNEIQRVLLQNQQNAGRATSVSTAAGASSGM